MPEKSKGRSKKSLRSTLTVSMDTRKKLTQILAQINKKSYGRHVYCVEVLEEAINRLSKADIEFFQERSLSTEDRLKRDHRRYMQKHGTISWDIYLQKRLSGELNPIQENKADDSEKKQDFLRSNEHQTVELSKTENVNDSNPMAVS